MQLEQVTHYVRQVLENHSVLSEAYSLQHTTNSASEEGGVLEPHRDSYEHYRLSHKDSVPEHFLERRRASRPHLDICAVFESH